MSGSKNRKRAEQKEKKPWWKQLYSQVEKSGIEGILMRESKVKVFVTICLGILEIINLFHISNLKEGIVAGITFVILIFLLFYKKGGRIIKWSKLIYIILLTLALLITGITQKPFFGLLADDHDPQAFYDSFSKGFYEYSIGNYTEALTEFHKIKRIVPEDEILNYYFWYMDAAIRTENYKLYDQLCKEVVQKIPNPTTEETRFLFQSIPVLNLVNSYNEGNFKKLSDELSPYRSTNEEIFTLFELASQICADDSENKNGIIESLFLRLPDCIDSFDNFSYVKKTLLIPMFLDLIETERYDLSIIALSELYSLDPAFFFESFFFYNPTQGNFLNVRALLLSCLQEMKDLFHEGWIQLNEDGNQLYSVYKEKLINLGLFLGSTDVFSEIEGEFDCLQFDKILENYSKYATIYNILPLFDGKYLFIVLEGTSPFDDTPAFSMADQAYFYILDAANSVSIKPITIDGEQLQVPVMMSKFFMVQKLEGSHSCLIEHIAGSGEYLSLDVLNTETESLSSLSIDPEETYHCSNFFYSAKNQHCNWNFEINNDIDPNMQTKVGGTVDAIIDLGNLTIDTQISYVDPALQLYVEKRNEQLIFPLATLSRLGGREIKDDVLLDLIRNNYVPYYHYSQIQNTFSYISEIYASDISGLTITYTSDKIDVSSETSYFFLVKRKDKETRILGIYKITDRGLKDVYANSFISKFFSQ